MMKKISTTALWVSLFGLGCAGVAPGDDSLDTTSSNPPIEDSRPGIKGDDSTPVNPHNPPDPLDCADTSALASPSNGHLGATTRITSLVMPSSISAATAMGCPLVAGHNGGQGLAALMRMMNLEVGSLVQPDATGVIPSIILGHLVGWDVGQTGNETLNLDLRMYMGTPLGSNRFGIDPTSMNANGDTRVEFEATVGCQTLETATGRIEFAVPVESAAVPLTLEASQVSGKLSVNQAGFDVTDGLIVGYVPVAAIVSIVQDIQTACSGPQAPTGCADAGILLNGDAESITHSLVLPFLYGLDARLSADQRSASACEGDDCNAMSVCLGFTANSVQVEGL